MEKIKAKIYKITNSKNDKVYIGSTRKKELYSRMANHISDCKHRPTKSLFYGFMNKVGVEYFEIVLIEDVEVDSRSDLLKLEEKYMNDFREQNPELSLNTIRSYTSPENKKIKKYENYVKHKDAQYDRQRKRITKNKESHDKYKKSMNDYYKNNKDKWIKNRGITIDCDCGKKISKANINRHKKTSYHKKHLNVSGRTKEDGSEELDQIIPRCIEEAK